jgi:LmbE family N-acetylglucosaminyl deacetylase
VSAHFRARRITTRPWRGRRWLVLAPHPDDETLGAGALIAEVSAAGCFAGLVILTDGSGSHPPRDGSMQLITTRKREAKRALRRLTGSQAHEPTFLGWKDAAPELPESRAFERTCRRVAALCVRLRVDVIATTSEGEPHCDHAAALELASAVQAKCKRALVD